MNLAASGLSRAERRPSRGLCVGYDHPLLVERAAVLRAVGFDVTTVFSLDHARKEALARPYQALVIGHLVPEDARKRIVEEARARSPRIAVVLLYRERIRDASCADAVLSVDSGPRFLANSLQYLLLESTSE